MNIEMLIQDSVTGKIYDVADLAADISWRTQLDGYAGKLTFTLVPDSELLISNGSPLSFKKDGEGVFFGFVFNKTKQTSGEIQYLAYDQSRYLKNKDTYVIEGTTASDLFVRLCKDFKLKHKVVDASSYLLPPKIHDNKSLYEIMDYGLTQALINTGQWFTILDRFGTLEFVNLNSLKTLLVISDDSLLSDYSFKMSIDDDTFNQVKLIQENEKTGKRDVYVVKDSNSLATWGTLQYFEKVDGNANAAQIEQRATTLLKLKNRETRALKLECLGDLRVRSGSGVVLSIDGLVKEGLPTNQYFMVTGCVHNFTNEVHTMQLEVRVSV